MLRFILYRCYLASALLSIKPLNIQAILSFKKRLINKYLMQVFFFVVFPLCFNVANSQQTSQQIPNTNTETQSLPVEKLLKQAASVKNEDSKASISLAKEALQIAIQNNNYQAIAQSHYLLGELSQQSKNNEQALHHFLLASLTYKDINDKRNQIISSIDYANIFVAEKRYDESEETFKELLSVGQEYGDSLFLSFILTAQGDSFYKQKHYEQAITRYMNATSYLLGSDDKELMKHLGETYTRLAETYKRMQNKEKTALFYKQALDIFTTLQNLKFMARTLNTLAEAERYLDNYVLALNYSLRSLEIHGQLNDPAGRAKALMGAGIIYRNIGRFEKSLKHVNQAHQYYKEINDANGIAKSANQMGLMYSKLKQFDHAKSFYQLTIEQPIEQIDSKTLATAFRELAVIDLNVGKYETAKVLAKKAQSIYQRENDKSRNSLTTRIIANIYRAQKDKAQAISYYRKSLAFAKEVGNKTYQIKTQTPLAAMLRGKNTDEAIELLKSSLELSIQTNIKSQTLYAYRELRKAEKFRGNIAEALRYAEEEISLSKIIQNEKEDSELVLEKAKLHSHKVELELESLKEQTRQSRTISELELTKNRYASIALASLLAICVLAVIFISRRFSHSRKRNRELNDLAARDPLTNCYNRRVLNNILEEDFKDINLLDEYCIILADIDHFKAVNDTYGHSKGDAVIRGVANILQTNIRQHDILARFGGEEFCIVLPSTTLTQANKIAESVRKKIETNRFSDITVTCSFGIASIKFNATSPTELVDQADLALYESKSLGRNQTVLWSQSLEG